MLGGMVGQGHLLLWLILLAGFAAFVVFLERAFHIHRARIKTEDFLNGILNILRKGNVTEALAICDETPGPVAYLVRTAVQHRADSRESLREAMHEAARVEIARMERRLGWIAIVAQIAPLLGLLGTVFGLMEMFRGLQADAPFVQMAHVSRGLLSALVTTAAGLSVAIPCYAGFGFLVMKIDKVVQDIEKAGAEMLAFLVNEKVPERAAERI